MGPGTVERLPLRRPRAVPERCGLPPMHAFVNHFSAHRSDLVDKSVHERKCGTGSRKERDGDATRGRGIKNEKKEYKKNPKNTQTQKKKAGPLIVRAPEPY